MTIDQFIKLEWMHKGVMSIHLLHEGLKSGRWLHFLAVIYFFNDKEYLLPVILWRLCFVYMIGIIVISSTLVIVSASVESTNVVCPHSGTYDLCIFAIFSKTGFLDMIPLCFQLSLC